MIWSVLKGNEIQEIEDRPLSFDVLIAQGVATSIDTLSVGFTTVSYNWLLASLSSLIIGAVTFAICLIGLIVGQRLGTRFTSKAELLGGIILIGIGIEIWITGVLL